MRKQDVIYRLKDRLRHPWPLYKRAGGISAVVTRASGKVERLGTISDIYTRRWKAGTHGDSSN